MGLWLLGAIIDSVNSSPVQYGFYCAYDKGTIGASPTPTLTWKSDGKKVPIVVKSSTSFSMDWGGKTYTAEFSGNKLTWSDGDIWECGGGSATVAPTTAPTPAPPVHYAYYCVYPKATISASPTPTLTWKDGKKTPIVVKSATSLSMDWESKTYTAEFSGNKLTWSDGDIWECGTSATQAPVDPCAPVTPAPVNPCAPQTMAPVTTTIGTTIKPREKVCPTPKPCPGCWIQILITALVAFLLGACCFVGIDRRCCKPPDPVYEIETQIYEKVGPNERVQLGPGRRQDGFEKSGDADLHSYSSTFR